MTKRLTYKRSFVLFLFVNSSGLCIEIQMYKSKNDCATLTSTGRHLKLFLFFFTEVTRQTKDLDVRVIIIDYESTNINIEAVLNKSSLRQFTVVRIPREKDFKRAVALQLGAEAVKDPHSVLFLCDLHLKIPSNLISTIRKVRGI